ncbi:flagellar hook-associated protein FlgL [Paenibacillus protaetiae]|uniref:Flagellar hook-associated protein FlgL n=1 Tax=Paenibacillus protaetiae TaxID=2509456 RepID=A0A4P6EZL4_9BACL|nr:flagellar hook-associated protein FlgL [Paenibacillus protaetiae]QAY67753.1 flagellar hook-associated protein FlgL [Paenibacillus protaetiae]
MAIRMTNGIMQTQLMSNLNKNMNRLSNLQNQSSSGVRLTKPSDDPSGVAYALRYRSDLSYNDQYQTNTNSALSWMDMTDSTLGEAGDIVKRIKELAVQGSNGTNDATALGAIQKEMDQLKNQLIDIGNSKLNGKYIFNGENFTNKPYDTSDPSFNASAVTTNASEVKYTISSGVTIPVNISGNDLFGPAGASDNLFSIIDNITAALGSNKPEDVSSQLTNIDSAAERISNARSLNGARTNRIELMQSRLKNLELNLNSMQSDVEDADMEQVLIDATTAQTVYEASLSVGSKILSTSLIDFIR